MLILMKKGMQRWNHLQEIIKIMKDIAIYGAGGFGREVACFIHRINQIDNDWNLIGFFDDGIKRGTTTQFGPVLGDLSVLNSWESPIAVAFGIGAPSSIKRIVDDINNPFVYYPNIVDPSVDYLNMKSIHMGEGNIIGPHSVISCNVTIGSFNIINVFGHLGHESQLGNCNVLMPFVDISGGTIVGNCNLFGVKSTVLQYIRVGNNVTIGSGSVIINAPQDNTTYIGNPARPFFKK